MRSLPTRWWRALDSQGQSRNAVLLAYANAIQAVFVFHEGLYLAQSVARSAQRRLQVADVALQRVILSVGQCHGVALTHAANFFAEQSLRPNRGRACRDENRRQLGTGSIRIFRAVT